MNGFNRRLGLVRLEDRCTPATLTGTAYIDANFNGSFDTGETTLANVSVSLDINGTGKNVLATATNSSGVYSFANVPTGVHTLTAVLNGYSQVTPNPVGVNVTTTGTISVDVGFAPSAVVSGYAFTDMNGNGSLDAGERLLPYYTVNLDLNNDGAVDATAITDANGQFHFTGVANGTHKITIANATTTPASRTFTVSNGADVSGLGFAVTPTGTLTGIAYNDANGNGVQDANETGLSGVTVKLDIYGNSSIERSVVTGSDGKYTFTNIPDGTHNVTATRTGYSNTTPTNIGTTYVTGSMLLPPVPAVTTTVRTPGDPVPVNVPLVPTSFGLAQSAIVSGFVYGDTNKNGSPDAGEPELQNVTVRLDTNSDGTFDMTTTTDSYGRYAFSGVPNGTHSIAITLPGGYTASKLAKTVTVANALNSAGNIFALTPVDPVHVIAVSTNSPLINQVQVLNDNGTVKSTFTPFSTPGDTRVAVGDVNGDTIDDYAVATGPGRPTQVRVLSGATGAELFSIFPFGSDFTGGAYVSLGDINGDGKADLAITPDVTGGPRVRIFSGAGFTQMADFFGIDDVDFRGGARTAIGDFNHDGKGDLVVAAGTGGGPRIALFDGSQLTMTGGPKFMGDFFAFEPDLRNGAFVAAGDVDGDGYADLIVGAGLGGAPRVTVFSGKDLIANTQTRLADFFAAGQSTDRSGATVAAEDVDGDGRADVVVGYRPVLTIVPHLAVYNAKGIGAANPTAAFDIQPFPGFLGGINVG
jgi:hypothetical protein